MMTKPRISYSHYRQMDYWQILEQIAQNGSQEDRWNYMCGLRGPDAQNTKRIKRLLTGFIRGKECRFQFLGIDSFEFLFVAHRNDRLMEELAKELISESDISHFINHAMLAIRAVSTIADEDFSNICTTLLEIADLVDEKTWEELAERLVQLYNLVKNATNEEI